MKQVVGFDPQSKYVKTSKRSKVRELLEQRNLKHLAFQFSFVVVKKNTFHEYLW